MGGCIFPLRSSQCLNVIMTMIDTIKWIAWFAFAHCKYVIKIHM